jgi:hypothetical protein
LSAGEKARQYASLFYPYRSAKEDVLVNGRRLVNRVRNNIKTPNINSIDAEVGDKSGKVEFVKNVDDVDDDLEEEEEEEEEGELHKASVSSAASDDDGESVSANTTISSDDGRSVSHNSTLGDAAYDTADEDVFEDGSAIDPFAAIYDYLIRIYQRGTPGPKTKSGEDVRAFMTIMDPTQTAFPKVNHPSIAKARSVRSVIEAIEPNYFKRLVSRYPTLEVLNARPEDNARLFESYVDLNRMDAMIDEHQNKNKDNSARTRQPRVLSVTKPPKPKTSTKPPKPKASTKPPKPKAPTKPTTKPTRPKVSKYEDDADYSIPTAGKKPIKPRSPRQQRLGKVKALANIERSASSSV